MPAACRDTRDRLTRYVFCLRDLLCSLYDNKVGFYFGARARRVLGCVSAGGTGRCSRGSCGFGLRRAASPRARAAPVPGDILAAKEGRRAPMTARVFPEPRPALLGAPGLALSETRYSVPLVTLPSPSINEHPAARLLRARLRSLARCRSPSRVVPGPCGAVCGGPAPLPALPSPPDQTRASCGTRGRDHDGREGQALPNARGPPGPREQPLRSRHPQRPRTGLPAPFPARCMPKRGAAEGETWDLTQSDSSRSRDINLVCHSAVSRRSAARHGRDSPQTPGSRADGCRPPPRFAPQGPSSRGPGSSWGGLGDAAGRAAPAATLSAGLWLPGVLPVSPPRGWITPNPQGLRGGFSELLQALSQPGRGQPQPSPGDDRSPGAGESQEVP